MKQYTTPEQTAKLVELGFEKPKSISGYCQRGPYEYDAETNTKMVVYDDTQYPIYAYSIGELIEMLPRCIESRCSDEAALEISYDSQDFEWYCGHRWVYNSGWRRFNGNYKTCDDKELIDALYRYIVALKEEGVI